jgi:F-type H+-transporting ATPase subunit b
MTVLLFNLIFLLAAKNDGLSFPDSGFWYYYEMVKPYVDYPGFELWKFINLGIYVAILVHFLRKPLSEKFKQKREEIRSELIRAEEAKKAALAELTEMESRLAGLEREKAEMLNQARTEAAAELNRISSETESEIGRMQSQADNEISRRAQQAESELRRLAATQSVSLAEQKIRSQITPEKDASLVSAGISSMGGAK